VALGVVFAGNRCSNNDSTFSPYFAEADKRRYGWRVWFSRYLGGENERRSCTVPEPTIEQKTDMLDRDDGQAFEREQTRRYRVLCGIQNVHHTLKMRSFPLSCYSTCFVLASIIHDETGCNRSVGVACFDSVDGCVCEHRGTPRYAESVDASALLDTDCSSAREASRDRRSTSIAYSSAS
jgi:hypothetical protein